MWKTVLLINAFVFSSLFISCFSEHEIVGKVVFNPKLTFRTMLNTNDSCLNSKSMAPVIITKADTIYLSGHLKNGDIECAQGLCDTIDCSVLKNGKTYKIKGHFKASEEYTSSKTFIVTDYKLISN